jgi:hypothetical protein
MAWGHLFITKLHKVLDKQWVYRNSYIHYKGKEEWTMPQIQEIIEKVDEYSLLDPKTLLPRHRFLLDTNFSTLSDRPTSHRLLWLVDMDSAISAAALAQSGTLTLQPTTFFMEDSQLPSSYPTLCSPDPGSQ